MSVAQEFMSFLVEQTEAKVGELRKQTAGETSRFVADELAVYVRKMRDVIPMLDGAESAPKRVTVRGRRTQRSEES